MSEHCCWRMEYFLEESNDIDYFPISRSYSVRLETARGTHVDLIHCPWCGQKLPEDLGSKWMEVLREECGLQDPNFKDADKVPEEFKSDVWWKKRGL